MDEQQLSRIRDALASIEELQGERGHETFAEASISGGDEMVLQINASAGVALCRSILDLITSGVEGKHQHFDAVNFVDEGEAKLIIVFRGTR